jgi:hypothetical protein
MVKHRLDPITAKIGQILMFQFRSPLLITPTAMPMIFTWPREKKKEGRKKEVYVFMLF